MFRNNTVLKVLSLVCAVFLWAYVINDTDPVETQTLNNVPVNVINIEALEEQGLTIQDTDGFKVSVKVKGNKTKLSSIDMSALTVTADVSGYEEGTITVPVKVTISSDTLTVSDVKPSTIELKVEKLTAVQKSVTVNFDGNAPQDTQAAYSSASPEIVSISGPESLVEKVSYVRAVLATSVLTADETEHMVELIPCTASGETVTGVTVSPATATVNAYLRNLKPVQDDDNDIDTTDDDNFDDQDGDNSDVQTDQDNDTEE